MVESEKQFLPYSSNPLLIETMSTHIFTAIDVIQYQLDIYCLIIGTSNGRLFTAFTDSKFKTTVFEELILPMNMRYAIKSITHNKVISDANDHHSYVIIITNHLGYLTVKLTSCQSKLCFQCWIKDCLIQKIMFVSDQCSSDNKIRLIADLTNHSSLSIHRSSSKIFDDSSRHKLLLSIVIPMSLIIFILCIFIIILLAKFIRKIKHGRFYPTYSRKTRDSSSAAHTYTNNIMYRTNSNKLFIERKNQQHVFPTKSELCIRRISSNPVYSTVSTQSLPSLVLSAPAMISSNRSQPLSVQRLYKDYV
jgi:hypothetical protein